MARAVPTYRSMNMADLIAATTKAPMEDVAAALKNGDAAKFCHGLRTAYGNLQRLPPKHRTQRRGHTGSESVVISGSGL